MTPLRRYFANRLLHCPKHIYTSLKTLHTQVMNPPVVRISPSPPSSSSGASSPREQHGSRDTRTSSPASELSGSTTTPRLSMSNNEHHAAPSRTGSALSTSSFSSQSSQQTIRASQFPQHTLARPANGADLNFTPSRLRSRSPRDRRSSLKEGVHPSLPLNANGDAKTAATTEMRTRRLTGSSSGTAIPLTRPRLASPTDTLGSDASSSQGRELTARPGVLNVLREWFRSHITSGSRAGRVAIPAAMIFVAVVLPLIAFIARLRMRRRSAPPLSPTKLITTSRVNTKPATGMSAARWLYQAVRDGVIMAGKGLV